MLNFETDIARQAVYSRDRRNKIACYKAASWLHPVRKFKLFAQAHPVSDWPLDELAVVAALLCTIGVVGLTVF